MTTTVAKRLPDGSLVEVLPDGTTRPMEDKTDWAAVDALTDEQIEAAALADPDAQPLPEEAGSKSARQGPPARVVRHRLKLSREEFCARYQIPMETLIAWETRKVDPGPVVRAYMKVIMNGSRGRRANLAIASHGLLNKSVRQMPVFCMRD